MRDARIRCPECGAIVPDGFASCNAVFNDVCAREYGDPIWGAAHLMTVDAYVLQHSSQHGPRSNAFHLMRLCRLIEHGDNPAIGRRPPRQQGKALEKHYRSFPYLPPPSQPGSIAIVDVHGARTPQEHIERVRSYAQSVWNAWTVHHAWAREWATSARGHFETG